MLRSSLSKIFFSVSIYLEFSKWSCFFNKWYYTRFPWTLQTAVDLSFTFTTMWALSFANICFLISLDFVMVQIFISTPWGKMRNNPPCFLCLNYHFFRFLFSLKHICCRKANWEPKYVDQNMFICWSAKKNRHLVGCIKAFIPISYLLCISMLIKGFSYLCLWLLC